MAKESQVAGEGSMSGNVGLETVIGVVCGDEDLRVVWPLWMLP